MNVPLSNGDAIILDKDAVFRHPVASGREWLEKRKERLAMAKELEDYTADELYDELDKCSVAKARLGRRRDQYTSHTRKYWNDRRSQVAAELRRRGLRVRRPKSQQILGTAAHLAVQREVAA